MRRLADSRVVHVQVAADGADHHLSGVQSQSDLDIDAMPAAHILSVPGHRPLHTERGIARAHGVILVSDWCTEQRHDPVAHDLIDSALVTMDRLHHVLEYGVEQLPGLLGISVGQ
jgi:hypothetical protein